MVDGVCYWGCGVSGSFAGPHGATRSDSAQLSVEKGCLSQEPHRLGGPPPMRLWKGLKPFEFALRLLLDVW
eukprot:4737049-Amphidinium_carterae.1